MTLLEILLLELERWPEGKEYAYQSATTPLAYFASSDEDAELQTTRLCQISPNRGLAYKVTREEWETAKIKTLPFFKDVANMLGEEEAAKELLRVRKHGTYISSDAEELSEAFAFFSTPQGFEFWSRIAEPDREGKALKEALDIITAAMDPDSYIKLHSDGSGYVDQGRDEMISFDDTDDLVNKYLAPTPKFEHWDLLQDRIMWIAKDSSGVWWAYDDRPEQSDGGWTPNGSFRSLGSLKIEIPCHWSKSLIKRPSSKE